MAAAETLASMSYFGKLPSRGDFVRTAESHQLMVLLDRWAGSGVELLAQDPGWKQLYDTAPPMHFAFLGSRSRLAIGGHFLPSRDATERRFPFLSATYLDISQPLAFIGRSPLVLARVWGGLARLCGQAVRAEDAADSLRELSENKVAVTTDPGVYDAPFADFLDMQDVGALQSLLHQSGHAHVQLRWVLPALGLLLQPVLTGAASQIDKALSLPLPRDALYRPMVAAFWLDLVSGFLSRADFELAVMIQETAAPRLVIGFNGADGRTLQAVLDPHVGGEQIIRVDDAEWVDNHVAGDYALNKLVSYIGRDDLSLRVARKAFGETFLGA
ncbi:type VI secretion system-associated protein TagF [Lysobacter enzymogenes]|uniref:Type VI secretion system-associated protein TagF n=1 Tax=Lysobacter enzymogenes TaxID=69 RepID=A0A3N2RPN5_LYSEN|nr:type VI secretion system-associated protein TagF [Lysobacter enzymogenes]ROU09394.1 type VI secretion system-associated protein TagF [Lysobacter enzymogenes]